MLKANVFTEMIVAKPLALRLHWWVSGDSEDGNDAGGEIFLQSIDMLWLKNLEGKKVDEVEAYTNSSNLTEYGKKIRGALESYVKGEHVIWPHICPNIPFLWHGMPPFRQRVLEVLYKEIGHGQTVTYGQLATLAGSPKAARAVGSAMAANPWPLIIP